jgi:hypothetical protein
MPLPSQPYTPRVIPGLNKIFTSASAGLFHLPDANPPQSLVEWRIQCLNMQSLINKLFLLSLSSLGRFSPLPQVIVAFCVGGMESALHSLTKTLTAASTERFLNDRWPHS